MNVQLLGGESKIALAMYLAETGWHLRNFDPKSMSFICDTERNGRTDDEIELQAREARVAVTVILTLYTGIPACIKIRYKVHEDR